MVGNAYNSLKGASLPLGQSKLLLSSLINTTAPTDYLFVTIYPFLSSTDEEAIGRQVFLRGVVGCEAT